MDKVEIWEKIGREAKGLKREPWGKHEVSRCDFAARTEVLKCKITLY